jgi:integrase
MRIYKRKGSPKWWATWNDQKGRRQRKSTGTEDKDLAQALAAKWQQESFMEQHFGTIPEVPFRDALLRYAKIRKRENPDNYGRSLQYQLQMLLDNFGTYMLTEISAKMVREFTDKRREEVKDGTVLRILSVLKAILNKAKYDGDLVTVPPFPKIRTPKGRTRWLTRDEERRLLAAAPERVRRIIAFALDTGGRRSELFRLDWRYVDLANGRLMFTETKNGEDRSIRLSDRALKVLLALGPKDNGPVFTYNGKALKDVKTAFNRARKKAGLEDVQFHDLRHTFASRLVQQGLPLYEVMHMTGHKSLAMVQRYAHLAPEYQERAIIALNRYGHNLGTLGLDGPETGIPNKRNPLDSQGVKMVGTAGIEPATSPV